MHLKTHLFLAMKIEQNEGTSLIDHDHDFSWDYILLWRKTVLLMDQFDNSYYESNGIVKWNSLNFDVLVHDSFHGKCMSYISWSYGHSILKWDYLKLFLQCSQYILFYFAPYQIFIIGHYCFFFSNVNKVFVTSCLQNYFMEWEWDFIYHVMRFWSTAMKTRHIEATRFMFS